MGFLDRVGKGLGGLVDIVEAPVQYGWDISRTFYDDDFRRDGIMATLWGSTINRFGQMMGGAFGEQGFGGQLAGAIPEPIRRYPSNILGLGPEDGSIDERGLGFDEFFGGGVLGFLEATGREFIREPLATAVTAASINDSGGPEGGPPIIGLFDRNKWTRAHEIVQTRSLGQAVALATMTKDVLDEDEVIKAQGSAWYPVISGGFDAAARIFLDTDTVLGGFVLEGVRAGRSQRLAVAASREADALRDAYRIGQGRNRALGLVDEVTDADPALQLRNRLDVRPQAAEEMAPADDLAEFFGETADNAVENVNATGLTGNAANIARAAGIDVNTLDTALATARRGDTGPLHRWAEQNNIKLSRNEVADYLKDPAAGAHALALKVADAKGFNNVDVYDDAGNLADTFDLGNFDESLEKSVAAARKKYGTGIYNQAMGTTDYVWAQLQAIRHGGWDEALKAANGRVDMMSRNLKYAREQFLRSPQWRNRALPWLSGLDETPLSQRIEIIRDRLFHDSADGDQVATWMALARSESERTTLMRFLMGDLRSVETLADEGMKRDITRIAKRRFIVRNYPTQGILDNAVEEFELLNDVDDLATNPKFLEIAESYNKAISTGDSAGVIADIEYYIRGGDSPFQRGYRERVAARERDMTEAEDLATLDRVEELTGPSHLSRVSTADADIDEIIARIKGAEGADDLDAAIDAIRKRRRAEAAPKVDPDDPFAKNRAANLFGWGGGQFDPHYGPPITEGTGWMDDLDAAAGRRRQAMTDGGEDADAVSLEEAIAELRRREQTDEIDALVDRFEARKLADEGAESLDDIGPRPTTGDSSPSVSDATIELQRLMQIATQNGHVMRMTNRGALRSTVHTNRVVEKVWQSKYNKMRVVFDMVAQPFLTPSDPMIVGKLKRHLRDAGFTDGEQMEWLGEFAALRHNDANRVELLDRINAAAMSRMGEKYDVEPEVVREIAAKVADAKKAASRLLEKNVRYGGYDRATNTQFSRWEVTDLNGNVSHVYVPFTPEQMANAHIMPNYREIDRAMKRVAGLKKYGYKGWDVLTKYPEAAADAITKVWKPAVLLRPAWPMRVVFDEQIRMMSVMGVMERMATMRTSGRELKMNLLRDMFGKTDKDRNVLFLSVGEDGRLLAPSPHHASERMAKPMADPRRAARGMGIAGALGGMAVGGAPGAVVGAMLGGRFGYKNAQLANGLQLLNLSSTKNLAFDGYRLLNDMGNPGDAANVFADEISAGRQLNSILSRDPAEEINRMRFDPRRWKNYFPADPGYEEMWQSVVNHQFANTTFSRMLWNDALEDDDIVQWLTNSGEGRKTLQVMPKERRENPEEWVAEARRFMYSNLMPGEELAPLRQRIAEGGHVNFGEVKRALGPNWEDVLGSVHGMEVIQITDRGGELARMARAKLQRVMEHLGKTPTDSLSRQPFFAHQYRQQIEKTVSLLRDDNGVYRLSQKELRAVEDQARRVALKNTRTLLYDLAEESQFAQSVRFLMPFFNAWQEVLTRYAGIAIDNPLYVSRLYKAYGGLDEIGETHTDDFGNKVQRIRLPAFAKGLVNQGIFRSAIDDQGYVAFNKKQLSMLGEAMPGFGPLVNVAVSEVARDRPELEESLGFLFPYGLAAPGEEGLVESFLPTAGRHLLAGFTENDSFQSTRARIALNALTTGQLNGEELDLSNPDKVKEFYAEITRQTKAFYSLRAVTAMTLPLSPQWQSPYQDYIDEWQKMRLADPETAEQRFLEQYGEEYFALTQSLTKTYDGVPATIEGELARDKYAALVEAYPEFGALIIGSEGGGAGVRFSRAIYDKQRHDPISEGNPQTRRSRIPLQDVITSPDSRLGWQKWRAFSDWKIEQMDRLGIRSLSQKGGEALSLMQGTMIDQLAKAHPEWYREFVDRDEAKWLRRVDAFEAIVNTDDEGLANRPDIVGLRQYLQMRRAVEAELVRRKQAGGSADLAQAKSNADLRLAWEIFQTDLAERKPMFADLHARWLVGDTIQPNTFRTTVG